MVAQACRKDPEIDGWMAVHKERGSLVLIGRVPLGRLLRLVLRGLHLYVRNKNKYFYMKLLTAVKGCAGPKSNSSPGFHYLGRIGPKLGHIEPVCLVVVRVRESKYIR
jgi:hypothetical protein